MIGKRLGDDKPNNRLFGTFKGSSSRYPIGAMSYTLFGSPVRSFGMSSGKCGRLSLCVEAWRHTAVRASRLSEVRDSAGWRCCAATREDFQRVGLSLISLLQ